jgi:predicted Zn-dependent peptidase
LSPTKGPQPALGRTEYDSGLRIVTEEMPSMRSVAMGVWVSVGSRDERPPMGGASHFLEHLLFKGTRSRSARDIAEAFDAVGGDLNAFTAKEATCYYCRVRDEDLPMAIEFMSDMLQHSVLAKRDFEAERHVILEEISMHEDDPGDLIHDLFAKTLWEDHPLGRPVLGTRETIASMSRDRVKRFYDRLYGPPHFVVAAAGNLKHEDVCRHIERTMDAGKRVSESLPIRVRAAGDAPRVSSSTLVRNKPTEQAHLCLGTSAYSRRDPDRFAFGVVNSALGGGMSSRLFQEIREKRGLAYSVFSYHSMFAETGFFSVYAGTTPSRAREVLSIVQDELASMAEDGMREDELERAKGHMKGGMVLSLEDTGGRMSRIGKSEISHGEILSVDQVLERIDGVTNEDVTRTAGETFGRSMALAVIGPFEPDAFDGVGRGSPGDDARLDVAALSAAGPGTDR